MIRFLLRRLGQALLVLFFTSLATFLLFALLPTGDAAARRAGKGAPPELVAHIRQNLGLNRTLPEQYWIFLKRLVLHFDLGQSYVNSASVRSLIASHVVPTLAITVGAALLWMVISIPVGIWSALRPDGLWDRSTAVLGLITASIPTYAIGIGLLYLLADDIGMLHVFKGAGTYDSLAQTARSGFAPLYLPWIALAIPFCGYYIRLMRTSLSETMPEEYVRAARAKGLAEWRVLSRYALRAAWTPIVTSFGLDVGLLLGGAVLSEIVFNIQGIGALSLQAVQQSDLPTIQGTVLIGAAFVVLSNLVVDIIQAALDPRLRTAT